jgi:hypothetical protein
MDKDAIRAVLQQTRDQAGRELLALLKRWPDQGPKIIELFGSGKEAAQNYLNNLEVFGSDAVPEGLKPEVLEAYRKLAEISVAGSRLDHVFDPDGVQAIRLEIETQTLALINQTAETVGNVAEQAGTTVGNAVENTGAAAAGPSTRGGHRCCDWLITCLNCCPRYFGYLADDHWLFGL